MITDTYIDNILVFRTDITQLCPNCETAKALNEHPEIAEWSVDCEDIDCVLRVVGESVSPATVISLINRCGHLCNELN